MIPKNIIILGAGTAGLVTGLILKSSFPNSTITIIKSSEVGIIGVGEGTSKEWSDFEDYVGIDHKELINNTDATIKIGILFKDWNFLNHQYSTTLLSLPPDFIKDQLITNFPNDIFSIQKGFETVYLKNQIPLNPDLKPSNQYHFNTFKLNTYLTDKCLERNINIEDHYVKNVNLDSKGNISSLSTLNSKKIKGDFYVDCSGFKRVISSELGAKWVSYSDYLPMNRAITIPTNLKNKLEPYTISTSLSSGWSWKIPTQTQYGNGYVFSDNYISSDQALNEFSKYLGENLEYVAKDIKFEAGKVDKFWIKNCVNIGLAGSFVEPLEAQSIGFSIKQALSLSKYLSGWDYNKEFVSKKYNEETDIMFNNVVDHIQTHYLTKKNDSKFWKDKPFKLTEFNKNTLEEFSYGYINPSYFPKTSKIMFDKENWHTVLFGLGIITPEKVSQRLNTYSPEYISEIKNQFIKFIQSRIDYPTAVPHKMFLEIIRNNDNGLAYIQNIPGKN